MAAVGAVIASAAAGAMAPDAGAAKRKKAPVITSVSPKNVSIGETLVIRGRNFVRGRNKNTVVFKRDNSKAVFVKAEIGTRKLLRVTVSDRLTDQLLADGDVLGRDGGDDRRLLLRGGVDRRGCRSRHGGGEQRDRGGSECGAVREWADAGSKFHRARYRPRSASA